MAFPRIALVRPAGTRIPAIRTTAAGLTIALILAACGAGNATPGDAFPPSTTSSTVGSFDASVGNPDGPTDAAAKATIDEAATLIPAPAASTNGTDQKVGQVSETGHKETLQMALRRTSNISDFRFEILVTFLLPDTDLLVTSVDIPIQGLRTRRQVSRTVIDARAFADLMRAEHEADKTMTDADTSNANGMIGLFDVPQEVRHVAGRRYQRMDGLLALYGFDVSEHWVETGLVRPEETKDLEDLVPFMDVLSNPLTVRTTMAQMVGSNQNYPIEILGTEQVDDVDTTRYRGVFHPHGHQNDYPGTLRVYEVEIPSMRLADLSGQSIPIDFWIDEDGLIRRLRYRFGPSHLADPSAHSTPEERIVDIRLAPTAESVAVEVPPADRVFTAEYFRNTFGQTPA